MKNIRTIITIFAIIATLHSCGLFKTAQKDNSVADEQVSSNTWSNASTTPQTIATNVRYEVNLDTMIGNGYTFEMPESMNANIDSLLNCWQARNMLNKLNSNASEQESLTIRYPS